MLTITDLTAQCENKSGIQLPLGLYRKFVFCPKSKKPKIITMLPFALLSPVIESYTFHTQDASLVLRLQFPNMHALW